MRTRMLVAVAIAGLACRPASSGTQAPGNEAKPPPADAKPDPKAAAAAAKRAQLAALPPLPGVEAPKPVKFPEAQVQTLANGLELIVLEDHEVPRVGVMAIARAGKIYAPADQPSLAQLTSMLLAEGTTKRDKVKLDTQVDATGGSLSPFFDDELSGVIADVLTRDAAFAFTAAAEVMATPSLPESAFDKLKGQIQQSIDADKASPFGLGARMAARLVYGSESAYGRPFPTPQQVEGMTRAQVEAFHKRHFVASNAMLVVAGDITPAEARKLADKTFGVWAKGEPVAIPKSDKRKVAETVRKIHIVDRKASAQASVLMVVPAPGIGKEGWLQIRVLEQALGGGLSGRLNMVLREQLGLTYGASAFHAFGYDGGAFYAGGSTKTNSAPEFLDALVKLLEEPGKDGVDQVELRRLLLKMSGQFAIEAEGLQTITMKTIQQRVFGLAPDFWERYRGDIESITVEQIKATSNSLINQSAAQVVIIGRADKLTKELSGRGWAIEVYNTDLEKTASPK